MLRLGAVDLAPDIEATMLLSSRTLAWILSHPSTWGREPSCTLLLICLPSRAADSLLCLDGQLAAALAALPHRRLQQHRH